tara:strand:- start:7 stop:648 length:642 start_codon:yes stop_codon:yes gene_type:complete
MEEKKLPEIIPVFPLSNFIIFPNTNVPLNIFEPRYIQMVDDAMRNNKIIGMVQPKKSGNPDKPDLFEVGCTGKITSYNETDDGRYLIVLNGISRFRILNEVIDKKLYRSVKVDYQEFQNDLNLNKEDIKFSDLELIFVNLKKLFQRQGYSINWKDLEKQSLDQTINTLSMASPFSLEEKQILLESNDINSRREKLEEILKTYILDNFSNTTVQ